MKGKKLYYILGGVLILLVIGAIYKSKAGGKELKVTVSEVKKRTIIETVSANGKVQPEIEVNISPDVSGEIVELPVREGQKVKKGDLLAKINPDIYASALQRMEASLNTTRANLANSKARLAQAKAQFINAKNSFERDEKLFDQGAISAAEYDAAKSSYEVAKSEVEAAEESVNAAEFNIQSSAAAVKEARDNLTKTTIIAPKDGTVSMLNVERGERVVGTSQMAGTEMMRIADLTDMEVKVDVNENDIVRVTLNDTAMIEVDAYLGRKFTGIVTEIANSANIKEISSDQVTTFDVKIRILRTSYEDLIDTTRPHLSPFRPGMSATVEIQTEIMENVTTVPIQAVTTREDTASSEAIFDDSEKKVIADKELIEVVFLHKDGKVQLQKVQTGIQDNQYIEILSGIEAGQEVVDGPYSAVSKKLDDGDFVEVVKKEDLYQELSDR